MTPMIEYVTDPSCSVRDRTPGSLSKTIAQGVEMGRPSVLQAQATKKDGTVTATYIGGRCIQVMSGTIDLA